ncbi:MAG: SDR family NAD(P)-dependent oxidoreductase, partial [Bacteroidota bacterium]
MTKNILITGGSRGIGLGIARVLAKIGHNLAINGIRQANQIAHILKDLKMLGAQEVIYCQGDISLTKDRERIVSEVLEKLGQVHVLINNAGVSTEKRQDLLHTTEESYTRVMDINLKGPFFLTQEVARQMAQDKVVPETSRCIINIS